MHGVLLLPKVLLYAVLLWSLVTIATPSIARTRIGATDAAGVMGIMLWRLLLGLLEGVTYPTMYVTVMDIAKQVFLQPEYYAVQA